MTKKTIYFLCTGNSCRSQIAEGFGKTYLGDTWNVYSAGIEAHGVNPNAIKTILIIIKRILPAVCEILGMTFSRMNVPENRARTPIPKIKSPIIPKKIFIFIPLSLSLAYFYKYSLQLLLEYGSMKT